MDQDIQDIQDIPSKPNKFIEVPDHHPWVWYMNDDSPWIELLSFVNDNRQVSETFGHVRTWIEENSNEKVFIQFNKKLNKKRTEEAGGIEKMDYSIILLFDDPADYMAFKIMFPEHCRK